MEEATRNTTDFGNGLLPDEPMGLHVHSILI